MQDSHDMWNANFGNFVFQTPPPPPPHALKAKKIKQKNWEKTNGCVPQDWEIWV